MGNRFTFIFAKLRLKHLLLWAAWCCSLGFIPLTSAQTKGATSEQVFEILASEIALQRGEAGLAYQTYLSLARQTADPALAQRAMEIAIAANAADLALIAAQTWDELSKPGQSKPKEVLVTLLMLNQRWSDAVAPAIALLKGQSLKEREQILQQWQSLLSRAQDEGAALNAYYRIVAALVPPSTNPQILYTYALAAEKSGQFEVMEKTLRTIIERNPNDIQALNALGYSLADRNIRLKNAYELIVKAHNLDPKDPFILDSLGWVNFRLGNKELALKQLQDAFRIKPEADIAAHLGEVLWILNRPIEAEEAWRQGELIDANNATLRETLKRLKPSWAISMDIVASQWDGRFAVKVSGKDSKNGGSGAFTLSHEAQTDILDIRSPMGGAMAKITINASGAKLEDGDKIFEAHDADALLQSYTGLPLPARGLSKWLNGEARVGAPASIERDDLRRAQKIIQDGWTMAFQWTEKNQIKKLDLTRKSSTGLIEIKLVFEELDD